MKQYRLSQKEKKHLIRIWETGKYNCKQLEPRFKISSVAIRGLLKRRGFKIPSVGRFGKGQPKTQNWYSVMKNKTPWNKGLKGWTTGTKAGFQKGNKNPMKRKDIKEKARRTGKNTSNWKGGLCKDIKYLNWLKNKRNRLKRKAIGSHTFKEWEALKVKHNWTCLHCGKSEPKIKLTEDHIIPLSKGGSDSIDNIQPLCGSCNSKKGTGKNIYFNK